ncbi:MAG: LEA type 2 family protein [bacterium]|nr:LEA type 2 family protein [bacterium]
MLKRAHLAALLVVCTSLSGCESLPLDALLGALPTPRIEGITPRIAGLDFQGVDLAFDVDVYNPYATAIKSPEFRYGLDIQGASFLNSSALSKLDLPASGVGTVTLPVRMRYVDIWKAYQSLKGAGEIPYTLKGALALPVAGETFELPLKKQGVMPVMRMPKFSALSVEPADVSLKGAKVAVKAGLENPNTFGLGLDGLGYALKIGDIELADVVASTLGEIGAGESREMTFTGGLSGVKALRQLLSGARPGDVTIKPTGALKTPYGSVALP